jgi:hypothetical protein
MLENSNDKNINKISTQIEEDIIKQNELDIITQELATKLKIDEKLDQTRKKAKKAGIGLRIEK